MGALHRMLAKAAPGDVAASALGAGRAVALAGFVVGPVAGALRGEQIRGRPPLRWGPPRAGALRGGRAP